MPMIKRGGYSLVESLVVIAGSGVVLALAVGLLHCIFEAERTGRQQAAAQQTFRRLAADFRGDAHASARLAPAEAVVDGQKATAWEFHAPQGDRKVRYHAAGNRLVREEQAAGKSLRREVYFLPEGSAAAILLEAGPPPLAVLRIAPAPATVKPAGLPLRIEAALASDHRLAKAGGK